MLSLCMHGRTHSPTPSTALAKCKSPCLLCGCRCLAQLLGHMPPPLLHAIAMAPAASITTQKLAKTSAQCLLWCQANAVLLHHGACAGTWLGQARPSTALAQTSKMKMTGHCCRVPGCMAAGCLHAWLPGAWLLLHSTIRLTKLPHRCTIHSRRACRAAQIGELMRSCIYTPV